MFIRLATGLHHAVFQLQQQVTRPKARFKPTLPKKSGVDVVPINLGQLLYLLFDAVPSQGTESIVVNFIQVRHVMVVRTERIN